VVVGWLSRRKKVRLEELVTAAPTDQIEQAKEAARSQRKEVYPALHYTEREYLWVLLYEHIQRGQIHPDVLRRMRTCDLEYIAGHPLPHPDLIPAHEGDSPEETSARRGRAMKIVENVTRATRELERRSTARGYFTAGLIGAAAGGIGAGLVVAIFD
jgi:hypothetical protein